MLRCDQSSKGNILSKTPIEVLKGVFDNFLLLTAWWVPCVDYPPSKQAAYLRRGLWGKRVKNESG